MELYVYLIKIDMGLGLVIEICDKIKSDYWGCKVYMVDLIELVKLII